MIFSLFYVELGVVPALKFEKGAVVRVAGEKPVYQLRQWGLWNGSRDDRDDKLDLRAETNHHKTAGDLRK